MLKNLRLIKFSLFFCLIIFPKFIWASYFPKNYLDLGYFNAHDSKFYIHQYVSAKTIYLPIFWQGSIQAKNGLNLMYRRNFFHTFSFLSIDWGLSGANWHSKILNQDFISLGLFLDLRLWLLRTPIADLYFSYSAAGPTYISRRIIDQRNIGGYFIFQDFMELGILAGWNKHLNLNFKIMHFSNGELLPENPGIDIPFLLCLGWTW